jgi:WS/DGAT/MGAT family acyltransferase
VGTLTRPVATTRLNATDATLWDIERDPSLRTTIVAVLMLDRPVARKRVLHDIEAASRTIDRMRQRVVPRPAGIGAPAWEIDPDFDIERHVRFVGLTGALDDATVAAVAEPMASEPFDRALPLWECAYVGGKTGRAALVIKVHHSLTDGVGGVQLLDALLDTDRTAPPRDLDRLPVPVPAHSERSGTDRIVGIARRVLELQLAAGEQATDAVFHPRRAAHGAVGNTRSALKLLAPAISPLSPLLLGRSPERRMGATDVDLARLHDAAARHGCTVNHAFFAAAIGGVAAYHRAHDAPCDRLRVTMPVSVRRPGDAAGGNQWAPVRFAVPADIDDPVDRMLAMRELVLTARHERALGFSRTLAGAVQLLPSLASSAVVGGMMRGVDLTLTNVPGLSVPHYFGGAAVERVYPLAPTAGAALNVALFSHVDMACVGTLLDAAAVAEPDELCGLIATGFDELLAVAERRPAAPPPEPDAPAASPSGEQPAVNPERLSALDTAFLRIESATTPMHIGAAFLLDGAPLRDRRGRLRVADIRDHVEARLRRLPRFTCRLAEVPLSLGRPVWVEDDRFDVAAHVQVVTADRPGDRQALLDTCADLFRTPLDRDRPMWELWLVDGLADGRVGIVEKIHHALIDGVSGVELAAALFDLEPCRQPERPAARSVAPPPGPARLALDAIADQFTDPFRLAHRAAASIGAPGAGAGAAGELVTAATTALHAARASGGEHRASFNREVGCERVLRAVVIDRATIDRARRPLDATVNDLVLAGVSGALRRWFEAEGEPYADVHVLVPMSTRHATMVDEPGNHVGAMLVSLPVAEPDRHRRLQAIQRRMYEAKSAHEGEGLAAVLEAADHLPAIGYAAAARLIAAQPIVDLVITNVPGLRERVSFLGAGVLEMVPVVPLGPHLGLGVAVLSYADHLTVSLFADPAAVPDIDVLAGAVADELAAFAAKPAPSRTRARSRPLQSPQTA